jgi:hypothetical protein
MELIIAVFIGVAVLAGALGVNAYRNTLKVERALKIFDEHHARVLAQGG